MIAVMVFSLTSCGQGKANGSTTEETETTKSASNEDNSDEAEQVDEEKGEGQEEVVQLKIQQDLPSLKDVYSDYFTVGVALPAKFFGDQNMMALTAKHFNSITAENSMKPESMLNAGNKGQVQFVLSDLYDYYATEHEMGLRGHTLVWHQQTPTWFYRENYEKSGPLVSKEVLFERMENYIKTVCEHYNGTSLYAWDVINEVVSDEGGAYRDSLYYQMTGTEYIEKAFEYARKYTEGSGIKLYYNDYNVVADETKRMAIYEMCKGLKDKGLIDGIGFQAHINYQGPSAAEFEETIELFKTLDLEISITELDMNMYVNKDDKFNGQEDFENRLIQQAHLYRDLFDVFVEHSDAIANVTFWSLKDDDSWLNYYFGSRTNWPVLFDKNYRAKHAFYGLVDWESLPDLVAQEVKETKIANAVQGTPIVDGEIDEVWDQAEAIAVDQYTQNSDGAYGEARTLWDEDFIYVLIKVIDNELHAVNGNPWEQDSVEVFIDENMKRSSTYEADDVQYRVNFENEVTVNGTSNPMFVSGVALTETGYICEMAIPSNLGGFAGGAQIGFDIQINDDQGTGSRNSMTNWNDLTGQGWSSTSDFGTLMIIE